MSKEPTPTAPIRSDAGTKGETAPRPGESFAEWLTRVERDQTHPNSRPRDAATLILLDRASGEPRVLLGRRHHGHRFMPGKFVFPGGRVEPADRIPSVAAGLAAGVEARLMQRVQRPSAAKARAFGVAVIRELFEETGLMIGGRPGPALPDAAPWRDFTAAGFGLDLSALRFVARAITPPRRPRRFDTRFFAIDAAAISHRVEGVVGPDTELVELVWMPLAQARALDMPTITKVVLTELEAEIAAGGGPDAPVPFYRVISGRFVRETL